MEELMITALLGFHLQEKCQAILQLLILHLEGSPKEQLIDLELEQKMYGDGANFQLLLP